MSIDHFSLAVDGLKPNFSHFSFAVLGRRISISIVPKKRTHGGGSYNRPLEPDTYIITVKVEFKKKVWIDKKEVNKRTAHIIAKLVATFKRSSVIGDKIELIAQFIKTKANNIFINIKSINKD